MILLFKMNLFDDLSYLKMKRTKNINEVTKCIGKEGCSLFS